MDCSSYLSVNIAMFMMCTSSSCKICWNYDVISCSQEFSGKITYFLIHFDRLERRKMIRNKNFAEPGSTAQYF